jgi:hypothetical protein
MRERAGRWDGECENWRLNWCGGRLQQTVLVAWLRAPAILQGLSRPADSLQVGYQDLVRSYRLRAD